MSDNNLPAPEAGTVDDAPLSIDAGVENLSAILSDPETDLQPDDEDIATAESEDGEEDPEIDLSEDVEDEADAEAEDGPQDYSSGRFAADNAKVTLEDGTVITVADLKRNNLFQRDYTKKTQELSEARKAFDEERASVSQQAQSLMQLAEKLNAFGQRYLPQPPEPFTGTPDTDPIGYMRHIKAREEYEAAVQAFNAFDVERSQLQAYQAQQSQVQTSEMLQAEFATLRAKDALFADPAKARTFLEEAVSKGSEWWGLTADDIGTLTSHKAYLILRDAMRYRKALAKAPEAQRQVEGKPKLPKANRRMDPRARSNSDYQQKAERLRKSGSIDDAASALLSLIK